MTGSRQEPRYESFRTSSGVGGRRNRDADAVLDFLVNRDIEPLGDFERNSQRIRDGVRHLPGVGLAVDPDLDSLAVGNHNGLFAFPHQMLNSAPLGSLFIPSEMVSSSRRKWCQFIFGTKD